MPFIDTYPYATKPIIWRKPAIWKRLRLRMELAISNAWRWLESAFHRLCNRLDAHPALVLLLLMASTYVGVLVAICARHAATGSW